MMTYTNMQKSQQNQTPPSTKRNPNKKTNRNHQTLTDQLKSYTGINKMFDAQLSKLLTEIDGIIAESGFEEWHKSSMKEYNHKSRFP